MLISVSVDERDAMYELVEAQKGTLNDVWAPFGAQEWAKAERAFTQHLQDCRFLECLRLKAPDDSGRVKVGWPPPDAGRHSDGMRTHELHEALSRLTARRTAQLVIEESAGVPTPQQEAFQERARLALCAAERCVKTLGSRYEIRYVVVDAETGEAAMKPTTARDFALDACEVLNESTRSSSNPAHR